MILPIVFRRLTVLFFLGAISSTALLAAGQREFSCFYGFSDVVYREETVEFTFSIELQNHTDSGAYSAVLMLEDAIALEQDPATIWIGTVDGDGTISAETRIVLSKDAYDRWQRGISPTAHLQYEELMGNARRAAVQMVPGIPAMKE